MDTETVAVEREELERLRDMELHVENLADMFDGCLRVKPDRTKTAVVRLRQSLMEVIAISSWMRRNSKLMSESE